MLPKLEHLNGEYASQFKDQTVVDVYQYRPAYNIIEELEKRQVFKQYGQKSTQPVPWQPTIEE